MHLPLVVFDIVPIISFHAVFKSKSGKTEDGGLLTPLVEP